MKQYYLWWGSCYLRFILYQNCDLCLKLFPLCVYYRYYYKRRKVDAAGTLRLLSKEKKNVEGAEFNWIHNFSTEPETELISTRLKVQSRYIDKNDVEEGNWTSFKQWVSVIDMSGCCPFSKPFFFFVVVVSPNYPWDNLPQRQLFLFHHSFFLLFFCII